MKVHILIDRLVDIPDNMGHVAMQISSSTTIQSPVRYYRNDQEKWSEGKFIAGGDGITRDILGKFTGYIKFLETELVKIN